MTHDSELVERYETADIAKLAIRGEVPPSSPTGKWVRYSDYEDLRARLAEVEGEAAEWSGRYLEAWAERNALEARAVAAESRATSSEETVRELREGLRMFLCIDFDRFTEHDELLLETCLADARSMLEKASE